jgi:hypothetical protein
MGPPEITIVGTSQLAAPITSEGVVLSQPHISTTPSMGLARIDSSTSMLTRLRNSMAVGRMLVSPSEVTGNSSGNPPASQTPFFTLCASSRKCALQGVSSRPGVADADHRPAVEDVAGKALVAHPAAVNEAVLSLPPNHACDRNFRFSIRGEPGSARDKLFGIARGNKPSRVGGARLTRRLRVPPRPLVNRRAPIERKSSSWS